MASHVTVTTNVDRVNTTDKPHVDVYVNDSNHKDDLTTNTQGLNDTSRIVNSQNATLTNDYPNTQRKDFDDSHAHGLDKNLHNQPIITPTLAKNDVEKTHLQSNDVGRTHLESNNNVQRPLVNDVGKTNITSYENVETDLNRKDHWRTPNQTNPTNTTENYHKDTIVPDVTTKETHHKEIITPDVTTKLKTDSHHHHHHHHHHHDKSHKKEEDIHVIDSNIHDTNKQDIHVHDVNRNDNTYVPDLNKNDNAYVGESKKKRRFLCS